jgi:hypothetical protein
MKLDFDEGKTFLEINRPYFWHNRTEEVKNVVRSCKSCQLVKNTRSIKLKLEEFKNIPIWDQFYKVALNTIGPLLKTNNGNRYVLVAIDHYSKWCEAKSVVDRDVETINRFLEDEAICRFSVPKYVLINNGSKWYVEFDHLCKCYGIVHYYTSP